MNTEGPISEWNTNHHYGDLKTNTVVKNIFITVAWLNTPL